MVPRFAPLQFAFCSVLGPSSVTPELLASVIDKIAAVASVTGLLFFKDLFLVRLHDSEFVFFDLFRGEGFLLGLTGGSYTYMYIIYTYILMRV